MPVAPLPDRELPGPFAEDRQIGRSEIESDEEAEERGGILDVLGDLEGRSQVGDGGLVEQTAQTDDLRRDPAIAQGVIDGEEVLALPREDRDRIVLAPMRAPQSFDVLGDLGGCGFNRCGIGDARIPLAGERRFDEHGRGGGARAPPQRLGDPVRRGEDPAVVAPRRGQGEHPPPGALRGEPVEEGVEGGGRSAPPPVDRLIGISDGRHRMVVEKGRQQAHLDDRGVLELVQEHEAVLAPDRGDRLGRRVHDPRGEDELIGEVEDPHPPLPALEFPDRVEEGDAPSIRADRVADRIVARGDLLELRRVLLEACARRLEVVLVLRQLPGKAQGLIHGGGDRHLRIDGLRPGHEDVRHQLDAAGFTEHAEVGIHSDAQRVLPDDPLSEGVVGERYRGFRSIDPRHRLREEGNALREPLGEFAGGLLREGESEDLTGSELLVIRQCPQDPHGHRLGLARTRARDDEQRPGGRLDDRLLLRRGHDLRVHDLLDPLGRQHALPHFSPPSSCPARRRGTPS